MSRSFCAYDVGAPSEWLAQAALEPTRKACAIPLGVNCGMNDQIISECCANATATPYSFITGAFHVCALPEDATNATYQEYQNCILNYPGRDGGFRCNEPNAINRGPNCNSLGSVLTPPMYAPEGEQICVTGALSNSSTVLENCCGNAPVAFEGGCWQYCIGPANQNLASCIGGGLREANRTNGGNVGCFNGTGRSASPSASTSATSNAPMLARAGVTSIMALVATIAWMVGIL